MVWTIYEELGSLCVGKRVESGLKDRNYSHSTARPCHRGEASKNDSEELELLMDQCYGATCIPASIDK